jgi:hypothetical protein
MREVADDQRCCGGGADDIEDVTDSVRNGVGAESDYVDQRVMLLSGESTNSFRVVGLVGREVGSEIADRAGAMRVLFFVHRT